MVKLHPFFLVSAAANKNACTTLLTSSCVVSTGNSLLLLRLLESIFFESTKVARAGDADDDSVSFLQRKVATIR